MHVTAMLLIRHHQQHPMLATRVVRSVFYGELDLWLRSHPHPSMARGLRDLRAALTLIVSGMLPRK